MRPELSEILGKIDGEVLDLSGLSAAEPNPKTKRWELEGKPVEGYRHGSYYKALDLVLELSIGYPEIMSGHLEIVTPGGKRVKIWNGARITVGDRSALEILSVPEDPAPIQEMAAMSFPIYRDPEKKPTCCADWGAARACYFFGSAGIGGQWRCFASGAESALVDDNGGVRGYLRPPQKCPLWKDRT